MKIQNIPEHIYLFLLPEKNETSWHVFGMLLNWAVNEQWFGRFQIRLLQMSNQDYYYFHDVIPTGFVNPSKFREALRSFLSAEKILSFPV